MGRKAISELASEVRSKNAGPFLVSLDVMFREPRDYRRAKKALTARRVAGLYGVSRNRVVKVSYSDAALAVKVTMLRPAASGSVEDTDVYGSQQHAPLLGVRV